MRTLAALLLAALLAGRASATWSIVLADMSTGEVAVGSATCITNLNLKRAAGVIVVGKGAAQAQALIDGGSNRRIMWNHINRLDDPEHALAVIRSIDGVFEQRQFGMAQMDGRTLSFTGNETIAWAGGSRGRFGKLAYAVQGNILLGPDVVADAVEALRTTPGDLSARLMAAMQAAADAGGDSRCTPIGKSSHVGYMVIARMGDVDGVCDAAMGCANGTYYMDLNVTQGGMGRRDVVARLQSLYDQFLDNHRGQVDQQKSRAHVEPRTLLGDGSQSAALLLHLKDIDGTSLGMGGASITVDHQPGSARLATIGPVTDLGDGRYRVPLTDIVGSGKDVYRVFVDTGLGPVMMYPQPRLEVQPTLAASTAPVVDPSATRAPVRHLELNLDGSPARAGRPYVVLGSTSGTTPGFALGALTVPLNLDAFTDTLMGWSENDEADGVLGRLDLLGTAQARLRLPRSAWQDLRGAELSFCWITLQPADFVSTPATLTLD